ncbi:MAG: TonB-dependent receptor [Acidobacteriia bacterium]|nr:TonB-dependent receptor [Terriglobia bacterium]
MAIRRTLKVLCLVAILMIANGLSAQPTFASLRGTVHDPSGAAIAKATVTVRNSATEVLRETRSDEEGAWTVFDLPPSRYEVTITAPGFGTERRTEIELTVDAEEVLDFGLNPSTIQSTVEVHAETPRIDLESTALSEVEDARAVRELPLNGRDWTQLALLAPGVSAIRTQDALNGSTSNRGSRGFGSEVTIGGTRPGQNNYLLDGISQNDYTNGVPGSALGLALGVDAIQEFSVLTNNYGAAYGGTSGGVINAVSRSGTNTFHGDLYEFLRYDMLDARNFFDGQKPPLRRNQFGAALGGPIQRDKTFFFLNYESLREALESTSIAIVPSAQARAGNLAEGKIVVSPAILPYLSLWPLPNGPLLGNRDTGEYIFAASSPATENTALARLDHYFSANDNLALSWSTDKGDTATPDTLNSILALNSLWRNTLSVNFIHTFNPQIVNAFRIGVNRVSAHALDTAPGNNPAGSDPSLGILPGRDAPALTVPGLTAFSGGEGGLAATNFWFTNFQAYDDVSLQRGKHIIKFGLDFIRYRYNTQVAADPNGAYTFASLADFLTDGKVTNFFADVYYQGGQTNLSGIGFPERGFRQNVAGAYFQDTWHWSPTLTWNLGLRYEAASVPDEVNGLVSNLRDIYSTRLFAGQPLFQNPTHYNFEPRVGFAWTPPKDKKLSIRAAFGVFDVLPLIYEVAMLEAYSGPFSSLVTLTNPPSGSFPFGGYQTILDSNQSSLPVREPSIEYNPPRNYVMQWNTSIERNLAPNLILSVAYAGSRGVHMFSLANDVDIVLPTYTPAGYLFPTPIGSGARLNPAAGSIRQLTWGDGSNYNSLQTRLRQQLRHGLELQGAFTWQKSIDGYSSSIFPTQFQNSVATLFINRHLNRGVSDFNVGRVGVIYGLWQLPKATMAPKPLKAAVNGWQLGGIFTISDGLPFTPIISGDAAGENSSGTYDVPNRVAGPACTHLTNPGNPSQYINLACYAFPMPANLLGNSGRNTLIGPGVAELDWSVIRNFDMRFISEASKLQFRAEAFNLANRPNFEPPLANSAIYNSKGAPLASAGLITSTATTSRQIQLALRLSW